MIMQKSSVASERVRVIAIPGIGIHVPRIVRRSMRPSVMAGALLLVLIVGFGVAGPWLIAADPDQQSLQARLTPPVWSSGDWSRPLGTDQLGRDMLARMAAGTSTSLLIGSLVTVLAGSLGVLLGVAAGILGGVADRVIAFTVDVQMAIPVLVLAVVTSALFDPGIAPVVAVLAVTGWIGYQRVVRIQTRSLNNSEFVEASRAVGGSSWWIARKHFLPNLWGPILVLGSQQIATVVLFESALSYLGLGVPAETITLGGMIADGRDVMFSAWWVPALPGVVIALLTMAFILLGDGLRIVLDPRSGR